MKSSLSICMLASGSKGNAIYVSDGDTAVLMDAGLSGVEIERRLTSKNIDPAGLSAICVSHEHTDHIHAVGVLSRRFNLPVYMSAKTAAVAAAVYMSAKTAAVAAAQLGKVADLQTFECGERFHIEALQFQPFALSHDATDPVGFTIRGNGSKIGIATDLGIAPHMVQEHLKGCHLLILEANHDPDMLTNGPYPWPLKQRIRSRSGHLSNAEAKDLLQVLQNRDLKHVILAHLSETNNTPEKAFGEISHALTRCHPKLCVARQDQSSEILSI